MNSKIIGATGLSLLLAAVTIPAATAQEAPGPAEAAGAAVNIEAQLLKDADNVSASAQELKPIALDSIPAEIDLESLPGSAVSDAARTLRDLDAADRPAFARTLRDTARGSLPGAAGARSAGTHSPSLPSAAAGRSRGRGPN